MGNTYLLRRSRTSKRRCPRRTRFRDGSHPPPRRPRRMLSCPSQNAADRNSSRGPRFRKARGTRAARQEFRLVSGFLKRWNFSFSEFSSVSFFSRPSFSTKSHRFNRDVAVFVSDPNALVAKSGCFAKNQQKRRSKYERKAWTRHRRRLFSCRALPRFPKRSQNHPRHPPMRTPRRLLSGTRQVKAPSRR